MSTTRKVDQQLIDETITTVKTRLKAQIANYPRASNSVTHLIKRRNSLSSINQDFMQYDADLVGKASAKGFRLITGAIPASDNFVSFCEDMVFNRQYPISKIITFGNMAYPEETTSYRYASGEDFYNVKIVYDANSAEDNLIRNATLTVNRGKVTREIEVTIFVQNPTNSSAIQNERLCILKKLYLESLEQNTFIFGPLSGQLILTFEMLSNFKGIFRSTNTELIADAIKLLLIDLRKDRHDLSIPMEAIEQAIKEASFLKQGLVGAEIESPKLTVIKPVRSLSDGATASYGKFGFASNGIAGKDEELDTVQQAQIKLGFK